MLILGLAGLVIGAHLVIRGSLNIAQHYKISQLFIGLTILAIGTDLPELIVAITGAVHRLQGIETSGLIVGEAIGTCMGQITLTLGVIGLFIYLTIGRRQLMRGGVLMLVSVLMLLLVGLDGKISRWDGIIFMLVYLIYFISLLREERVYEKLKRAPRMHLFWSVLSIIAGFGFLIYCSNLVVTGAIDLANAWGVKQSLIGIILVGLGTSLPEIVLTIGAIIKKAPALSVGNLIGSNIFDILFPLGIGAAISEFLVSDNLLRFDILFLFISSGIVFLFFLRKKGIQKKEALALIAIYLIYIGAKLIGL